MKNILKSTWIFLIFILSIGSGCNYIGLGNTQSPAVGRGSPDMSSFYTQYAPTKIDIMPLTEFFRPADAQQEQINLYVRLLDSFNSQIKAPGVFRLELYEYVQLSSEPKGKRIILWPDIDLTDPAENNKYWRDFLRAYEFNLTANVPLNQSYILEVTCLCSKGRRLIDEFILTRTD